MLNWTVEFALLEKKPFVGEEHVAGAVGLTGAYNGMIYLYASAVFSRCITCRMLSMPDAEIEGEDMINDVMGELANMVAGQIKTKLDNQGNGCMMTIPSVVRGTDFKIAPVGGAMRRFVYFHSNGGEVVVEILLKPTN